MQTKSGVGSASREPTRGFRGCLRYGAAVGALVLGLLQLVPAAARAAEHAAKQPLRIAAASTSDQLPVLQFVPVSDTELAAVRGRGASSLIPAAPSETSSNSVVLWDEGIRPVTVVNSGTSGNVQSSVVNGGQP